MNKKILFLLALLVVFIPQSTRTNFFEDIALITVTAVTVVTLYKIHKLIQQVSHLKKLQAALAKQTVALIEEDKDKTISDAARKAFADENEVTVTLQNGSKYNPNQAKQ